MKSFGCTLTPAAVVIMYRPVSTGSGSAFVLLAERRCVLVLQYFVIGRDEKRLDPELVGRVSTAGTKIS